MSDEKTRPETGPMSFGEDWPGLFVRGDNALQIADYIEMALEERLDLVGVDVLKGHIETLRSCHVRTPGFEDSVQKLKDFEECIEGSDDA